MSSHKNKKANSANAKKQKILEAYIEENREKDTASIAARKVIYAHASKWLGTSLEIGDTIPTLQFSPLGRAMLGGKQEFDKIIFASKELKTTEIKGHLNELKKLMKDAEALRDKLAEFDPGYLYEAEHAVRNFHSGLEGRMLNALGLGRAAYMGVEGLAIGLIDPITKLEIELMNRGPARPGRARDQAALRVAEEAGIFLVSVTGELPTFGDGKDGLTGKFAPFLRDLYDAFGWPKRDLRAGTELAIANAKGAPQPAVRMGSLDVIPTGKLGR